MRKQNELRLFHPSFRYIGVSLHYIGAKKTTIHVLLAQPEPYAADGADVDGGRCRCGRRSVQMWTADGADMDGGRCRYPLLKV